MATIKGTPQAKMKEALQEYLNDLLKEDIQIDEMSLEHYSGEWRDPETPYIVNHEPTGVSSLHISFTNLKIQKEFNKKSTGC